MIKMQTRRIAGQMAKIEPVEDDNQYHSLAAGILLQAVTDWKNYRALSLDKVYRIMQHPERHSSHIVGKIRLAKMMGFATPRDELIDFFAGDWYETLCDICDLDADVVRKKIGIHRKAI